MKGNHLMGLISPLLKGQRKAQETLFSSSPPEPLMENMATEAVIESEGSNTSKIQCPTCKQFFASQSSCRRHIRFVHLKQRNYKCPVCRTTYQRRYFLEYHTYHVHNRFERPRPFWCKRCGQTFFKEGYLDAHLKSTLHHLDGRSLRELRPAPARVPE